MIRLIGKIKKIKNIRILNIYSKNLASEISKKNNKIFIENFKNGIIIKPNGSIHATIAQGKRIQISITNLIKNGIISKEKTEKDDIFIYLEKSEWNIKEILQKTKGCPLTEEIPKDLIEKKAAFRKSEAPSRPRGSGHLDDER